MKNQNSGAELFTEIQNAFLRKPASVTGTQNFMGHEIPVVLGGFGENAKCISDKTIAEIHGQPAYEIRKSVGRNITRFNKGVDYIDLAERSNEITTLDLALQLGYSKQAVKQADHIYLLSERGYAKIIKIMDTDLAWEIHDHLVDEYFTMREHIQTGKPLPKSRKSEQELAAADKRAKAMMLNAKCRAVDRLEKLYDRAGVKPEYQALAISDLFAEDGVKLPRIALQGTRVTYDKGTIAEKLGVRSTSGLPHAQLIGAIIKTLNVPDSECEAVPYHRNGHDGTDYQYTEAVVDMIGAWLKEQGYPNKVTAAGKTYTASYIVRYAGATG